MGQKGVTTIDFGAHPGSDVATVQVTGQTAVAAGAVVDAWLLAKETADHSIDEHVIDGPTILAGSVTAGVGFTIHGLALNGNLTGAWSVAWVWDN